MQNEVSIGQNRTGTATSPKLTAEMIAGTSEFPPDSADASDGQSVAGVRADYLSDAEQVGSMPPPVTLGGMASAAVQGVRGTRPAQFLDKLGERLAFERSGVRLYEALIAKFETFGGFEGGPALAELDQILHEEHRHFQLLTQTLERLGGDPTAITPSADVAATLTRGVLDVLVDPRTTLLQSLEAILVAELVDNDCWDVLVALAGQRHDEDLAERFVAALEDERRHLDLVRAWIAAAQNRSEI
jgi:rubrerythrin